MKDQKIIQEYINNFRRHLSKHLKPGFGVECKVYPSEQDGAIFEFTIDQKLQNKDIFQPPSATVNEALKDIPQNMFGGNLGGIKFGGTNISLEGNRIVMIKGENEKTEWTDDASNSDVSRIITSGRSKK